MKKYFFYTYILFLLAGLFGCSKKDESLVFGNAAQQRALTDLKKDQLLLTSAPYGWKAVIFPGSDIGRGFFFKFNDQNQVQTYPDPSLKLISPAYGDPGISSYQLKSLQRTSLIFDTYSSLSILSDPQNGVRGSGYSSDIEFSFTSASSDTIRFTGNFNQTPMTLIKATAAEYDAYQKDGLQVFKTALINYSTSIMGKKLNLAIDATHNPECTIVTDKDNDRTFTLIYTDSKGVSQKQTTKWGPTVNSLFFQTPILYNDIVINEVFYDTAKLSMYIMWKGKRYEIVAS
ncbi:DUF4302 domain-containing protein [Pedobacter cryoconitis]|uniref:DUF4302 domain-containing protein n=1 Tax=Pedobacter cryoconitis TaxID=188932 RepID=A0A7X0MGW2_9SPHI|nr:DUF4302 domain-containing protein [Pedobacter cryoconitis]MBB6498767.1 hypothetical protein [Pedobacter cryoconitis]